MSPQLLRYREVDSTNTEAGRLLKAGELSEGAIILADYQRTGRGQGDHSWISSPGKNLLMSWVMYPAFLSVSHQFSLSKAVSLAIRDLLSDHGIDVMIKWPNDILCRGNKICGILLENSVMGESIRHSIAGIGLNVNQESFPDFPWKPTSMKLETGREKETGLLAGELGYLLAKRCAQLQNEGPQCLDQEYLQAFYYLDESHDFTDGEKIFPAVARGVDESGRLLLEINGATDAFGFHEVKMIY